MPKPMITAGDLADARVRLGLTPEQFAVELELPPDWYKDFEAGRAKLPRHQAQLVAFRLACAERDDAFAKSGLPTCPWTEQWKCEAPPADADLAKRTKYLESAQIHAKSCAICQAREQFERKLPPMPAPPLGVPIRIIVGITSWIEARPAWARPALSGAVILAALTSIRAVFMILGAARQPQLLLTALEAIIAASMAGAGGGLVYSFIGRPARRVPILGPYLAGIITVAGYMGCILALVAVGGGRKHDLTASVFAFGIVTLIFGVLLGYKLFRPTTNPEILAG